MSILKAGRPSDNNKKTTLRQLGNQDKIIKMCMDIAESFHTEIKQFAVTHRITLKELIQKSVKEYINKYENTKIKE